MEFEKTDRGENIFVIYEDQLAYVHGVTNEPCMFIKSHPFIKVPRIKGIKINRGDLTWLL